jgi:heme a synthase
VYLLLGLVRRGVAMTVALIAGQGALGHVQYHTGVPPLLVVLHMLGAGLVFAAAAWTHLLARRQVADGHAL